MKTPRIAIITGYGINSDYELAASFNLVGGEAHRVHINDLIEKKYVLTDFDIIAVPGGFSFGDHIASGKIFANKLKTHLGESLRAAVAKNIPVIGICNGFQVLVKLGLLPGNAEGDFTQTATLTYNDSGKYEDRWCYLSGNMASPCIWTKGIEKIYLPVRHGEGKFVPPDAATFKAWEAQGQICFRYATATGSLNITPIEAYPQNPNGSYDHVAGICSASGLLFGLMPHPEAFMLATNHPQWQKLGLRGGGAGLQIFRNAVEFVKGR